MRAEIGLRAEERQHDDPLLDSGIDRIRSGKPYGEVLQSHRNAALVAQLHQSGPLGQRLLTLPPSELPEEVDSASWAEHWIDRVMATFQDDNDASQPPPPQLAVASARLEQVSPIGIQRYVDELQRELHGTSSDPGSPAYLDWLRLQFARDVLAAMQ
jgi:hypothetical protein